jgi:hypothetical protein
LVKVKLYVVPTPPMSALLGKLGVLMDCTLCRTLMPLTQVQVTFVPTGTVSTAGLIDWFLSLRK